MMVQPIIWECSTCGIHGSMTIAKYRNGIGISCNKCEASAFIPWDNLKSLQGKTVRILQRGLYELAD